MQTEAHMHNEHQHEHKNDRKAEQDKSLAIYLANAARNTVPSKDAIQREVERTEKYLLSIFSEHVPFHKELYKRNVSSQEAKDEYWDNIKRLSQRRKSAGASFPQCSTLCRVSCHSVYHDK